MIEIEIVLPTFKRKAILYDEWAKETVNAIVRALPIRGVVRRWGDEIYFETDVEVDVRENSRDFVELGDIAYWIEGRAICIFFGKTPISDDKIRPITAVNVIGKVEGDLEAFKDVHDGEIIELRLRNHSNIS